jgi:hypothetical protein
MGSGQWAVGINEQRETSNEKRETNNNCRWRHRWSSIPRDNNCQGAEEKA